MQMGVYMLHIRSSNRRRRSMWYEDVMLSDGEDWASNRRIQYYQMVRIWAGLGGLAPAEEESEVWAAFNLDQRPKLVNLQASLQITINNHNDYGDGDCFRIRRVMYGHICHHICYIYVTILFLQEKILLPGQTWQELWNMLWLETQLSRFSLQNIE